MDKIPEATTNLAAEKAAALLKLFPECAGERGEVDFEKLKQTLADHVIEGDVERYQFMWPGKRAAMAEANVPTTKTLAPCEEESVDFAKTQNLYIEGDNLEVLKILRASYLGQVKMIYIDPPYNTGKDFVYHDHFSITQEEVDQRGGNVDDIGRRFTENSESNPRYHSDWCSMMYPRLKLARDLMRDDGVIFISISDVEVVNARKICDQIFGDANFVAQIVWTNKEGGGGSDSSLYKVKHEYVLVYAYEIAKLTLTGEQCEEDESYTFSDKYVRERGKYKLIKLNSFSIQYSVSLDYPIELPNGEIIQPTENGKRGCWRWSREKFDWGVANGYVEFKQNQEGKLWVYTKQYFKVDNCGKQIVRTLPPSALIDKYSSTMASKQVEELFGYADLFDYTKPYPLIRQLVHTANCQNHVVLDFFSGSATTAHAVMQLNAEDGGNRKFIMVQLPELTYEIKNGQKVPLKQSKAAFEAGFENVCEIGKERIRRAGKKIKEENATNAPNLDIGFRVLKVVDSPMVDASKPAGETTQAELSFSSVKTGVKNDALLFHTMLRLGVAPTDTIEYKTIEGNKVACVGGVQLVAALDAQTQMTNTFIEAIMKMNPGVAVFRDDTFRNNNALRISLEQTFKQLSPETKLEVI